MSVASATLTPEARGLARDEVRLAVVTPGGTEHTLARELPRWLTPGDLLVVNTSATLPAAVDTAYGAVHVSTELDDGAWVVELRRSDGHGHRTPQPREVIGLPGGVRLRIDTPHPAGQTRLWRATSLPRVRRVDYLSEHGRPIRYPYLERPVRLEDLQNVYADRPGSAEMPSAGRPLTRELLVRLMASGVLVAPLLLHTGVASQESHEPPQPEWFSVPAHTARLVKLTKLTGGRVIAVGTTVVRALESVAATGVREGWTDLVLGPERPARVVDGLLTGLHEPEASHLHLLESVAGPALVGRGYADLATEGAPSYLWHELGDSMLLLP
ncbi:S-adenosylmethionine:tRNA ribosyltransferase-isomerase [Nocardioides dilutus]